MAILKVARLGHPLLRRKSAPVTKKLMESQGFQEFCDDMIATMHEYEGVGLAAPQVHTPIRVIAVHIAPGNTRYKKNKETLEETIFVNPEITLLGRKKVKYWEGCLSVPGLRGEVERFNRIALKALDRYGKKIEAEFSGFPAIALQHEVDHLDGILYVDKLTDKEKFSFENEYERFHLDNDEEKGQNDE